VGALMGFAVTQERIDATALALYAGSIAWVIGYDTIYAHQDAEDDALIGIKSTALLFGARTKPALMVFYATAVALIGVALMLAGAGLPAWIGLARLPSISSGKSDALRSAIPRCACGYSNPTATPGCCCSRIACGCGDAGRIATVRSPDERSDIRGFRFPGPACRLRSCGLRDRWSMR